MSATRRASIAWQPDTGGALTLESSEVVISTPVVSDPDEGPLGILPGRVTPEELFAGAEAACFALAFADILDDTGFRVEVECSWVSDRPVLPPAAIHIVVELDGSTDDATLDAAVAAARDACALRAGDRVDVRR